MRQKLFIFLGLIFLIMVLIGLNAASYVEKDKTPDTESRPNRSTFNAGATGTRALYQLLAETGRQPTRWQQEPPADFDGDDKTKPQTFVVIGQVRRKFDEEEIERLLDWVSSGGKLVVIDREPPTELIAAEANWNVSAATEKDWLFDNLDPSNVKQMTADTLAAKPSQPTVFTQKINAVQPSRLASSIHFERRDDEQNQVSGIGTLAAPVPPVSDEADEEAAPPKRETKTKIGTIKAAPPKTNAQQSESPKNDFQAAPVAHLANNDKTLLVDFQYGGGQIVFLSDPYIVSNGGINLVDNAQLAINVVASRSGIIAFDEYHQGYGGDENRLLNYFAGTPVIAIFLQLAALVAFIFFTQSRRFARPLPTREPNRLSKLEYVSAMAELQQRTRAYDLAIENIYTEFRRRVARLVGADNSTASHKDLARLIAERARLDAGAVENLLFKCEDIVRGEPTNKREVTDLISRLRDLEEKLGLKRRKAHRSDA